MSISTIISNGGTGSFVIVFIAQDARALVLGNGSTGIGVKNAFEHTHVSAQIAFEYGRGTAELLGNLKEEATSLVGIQSRDEYKDQYNNELGRRVAEYLDNWLAQEAQQGNTYTDAEKEGLLDDLILDVYNSGGMISNSLPETNDPRIKDFPEDGAGFQTPENDVVWTAPTEDWQGKSAPRDYSQVDDFSENPIGFTLPIAADAAEAFARALPYSGPGIVLNILPIVSGSVPTLIKNFPDWLEAALSPVINLRGIAPNPNGGDPLVLDIDGSGTIDLISLDNSNIRFDFWGDGFAERVGWVAPQDGLLAVDWDGNGNIDDVSELFGTAIPLSFFDNGNSGAINDASGFADLSEHDSNQDGIINAQDDIWSELRIWQDLNQNGLSEDGELIGLDNLAIQSIDVAGAELADFVGVLNGGFTRSIEGNLITHTSQFTKTDGQSFEVVDAWFSSDFQDTAYTDAYTLDVRTLLLPTLSGYGQIPDLFVASSIDNGTGGLLEQVQAFTTARTSIELFTDYDAVRGEVEGLMYAWAGLDANAIINANDYAQHGQYSTLPEFEFLRRFVGLESEYTGTWFDGSAFLPNRGQDIEAIYDSWENVVDALTARLVFQIGGAELFEEGASYNPFSDTFEGDLNVSIATLDLLEAEALTHSDVEGFWNAFAKYIDQVKGIDSLTAAEISAIDSAINDSSSNALDWAAIQVTLGENNITAQASDLTITGTRWDDYIVGNAEDNLLIGGAGDDYLQGRGNGPGDSNNIFDGGLGNDTYLATLGDETFRYDYGHDVIIITTMNFGPSHNIIEFGAGITSSDVSLNIARLDQAGLFTQHAVFDVEGRGSISVRMNGANSPVVIDELHFDDGSVVLTDDLDVSFHGRENADDNIGSNGWFNAGDHYFYGYGGDDIIQLGSLGYNFVDGGAGDDVVYGSSGTNEFHFSGGNDQYVPNQGQNTISLPEGYTLDDVGFYRHNDPNLQFPGGAYRDALIEIDGLGSISIVNHFVVDRAIQTLEFFDNTTVDLTAIRFTTRGTAADDDYYSAGGSQNDDIYTFSGGVDTLYDYTGDDKIIFSEEYTLSDLNIFQLKEGNSHTNGGSLVIEDVQGNSLTVTSHFDQRFVQSIGEYVRDTEIENLEFSDENLISISSLEIDIYGGDGVDSLIGLEDRDLTNDDRFYGGKGDDNITGGTGTNTAVYDGAYTHFTIVDYGSYITIQDNVGLEGRDQFSEAHYVEFIDGIYDVSAGVFNAFPPSPLFLEAENLTLDSGASLYGIESRGSSSGGQSVVLGGASGSTGIVATTFSGISGAYNLNIGYYDESDGVSSYDLHVNGVSVSGGQWVADQDLGSGAPVSSTLTSQLVTNLTLTSGDLIELHATKDQGEGARVDTYSFTPASNNTGPDARDDVFSILEGTTLNANVLIDNGYGVDSDPDGDALSTQAQTVTSALGVSVIIAGNGDITYVAPADQAGSDSFTYTLLDGRGGSASATAFVNIADDDLTPYTWEAESMVLGGDYEVVASGGASNGAYVQVPGSGQTGTITIASNFTGADGFYDVDIFYWDENDGQSAYTLEIIRSGSIVDTDTWVADQDYGVGGSNSTNRVAHRASDLDLRTGDLIKLSSGHDGGENARVDNFVFMPLAGQGTGSGLNQPTAGDDVINGTTSAETISALAGNDIVNGNGGGDTLNGNEGDDELYGADGVSDILNGGTGNDLLHGRSGDDFLYGDGDNDELWGFSGSDTLDGGAGTDSAHYNNDASAIDVNLNAGTVTDGYGDTDTVINIEAFYGSGYNDTMQGNSSNNEFRGLNGDDTLKGGGGNDTLLGNNGDDMLYGEDGYDVLQGYSGADSFIFESASAFNNVDRVKDFKVSQNDVLDISDVLEGHYTASDDITEFAQILQDGTSNRSYLAIDIDGTANGANFIDIARLDGITGITDVAALELSGNLKTEVV